MSVFSTNSISCFTSYSVSPGNQTIKLVLINLVGKLVYIKSKNLYIDSVS